MLDLSVLDMFVPMDRLHIDAHVEGKVREIIKLRDLAVHKDDQILKEPIREFGDLYNQIASRFPHHVDGFAGYVQMVAQIQQGARVQIARPATGLVTVGH